MYHIYISKMGDDDPFLHFFCVVLCSVGCDVLCCVVLCCVCEVLCCVVLCCVVK